MSRAGSRPVRAALAATIMAAAAVAAVCSLRDGRVRPSPDAAPTAPGGYATGVGAIHVHTRHSDGAEDLPGVVTAARAAGLDFVVVTDHNTFAAKPDEGYHRDVLVLVGTEISTDDGHILALGLDEPTYRFPRRAVDVLRDVAELGGAAFAAHPTSPKPDLRWRDRRAPGAWGLEVVNGDTQWRTASRVRTLASVLLYPFSARRALSRLLTRPAAVELWDELLARRPAAGIVGIDAHTPLPSYESLFRIARNHLVLDRPLQGDATRDGPLVVDALTRGRSFIGLDGIAPSDGFFFVAERAGRTWTMGDTVAPGPALRLRAGGVRVPDATFTLRRNGGAVVTTTGTLEAGGTEPGVYRVEVSLPGDAVPWIMSNALYLFDERAARRRLARAALPAEPAPVTPIEILERFAQAPFAFTTGSDAASVVTLTPVAPADRPDGAAARIDYRLAEPRRGRPAPYAALASFDARDLSAFRGLTVTIKADGVSRLWIQVRDRNPRSPEQMEWWTASIKTTDRWQRIAVPFTSLRSRDPDSDRRLDLDAVVAIILVMDGDSVHPGSSGTLWIDDIGVY